MFGHPILDMSSTRSPHPTKGAGAGSAPHRWSAPEETGDGKDRAFQLHLPLPPPADRAVPGLQAAEQGVGLEGLVFASLAGERAQRK